MKAVVFLNGEYKYSQEFINNLFDKDTILFCADGGADYAYRYGKNPLYIIGDLDSVDNDVLKHFKSKGVNIVKYNPEKDYTDFELILQKIGEFENMNGFKFEDISILGALGKRTDFTLNNLFLMENYPDITILSENEEIFYKEKPFSINNKKNYGFSIIPLDEMIKKLTLKGFKYETFNLDVERKVSRLVSNIIISDECKVDFEKGKMLVVLRKN